MVFSAGLVTYTDSAQKFDQSMVGKEMRMVGSTTVGNDGTFKIKEVVSPTVVTWENATGVTENFPITGEFRMRRVDEAPPKASIWSSTIRILNLGAVALYVSFNGVDDQGIIPAGATHVYRNRAEAGLALRSASSTCLYAVEAW
jgi:hypothetical protein